MTMTPEHQLQATATWYKAMHERMENGIDQGKSGWDESSYEGILAQLENKFYQLRIDPSRKNAADVANLSFILAEIHQRNVIAEQTP